MSTFFSRHAPVVFGTVRRTVLLAVLLTAMVPSMAARPLQGQSVTIVGPPGSPLPTATPAFTVRATGFSAGVPLRYTVQVATSLLFSSDLVFDTTLVTTDTEVTIQMMRLLPSETPVYWKARVQPVPGFPVESGVTGPRITAAWLTLISPNSPIGDIFAVRRPTFVWRSAPVVASLGRWRYDIEVTSQGRTEQTATGLTDTTWQAVNDLQSNTSYRWRVRAYLANGVTITETSVGSFLVQDQPLPVATLLYQNFPNPFPSPASFSTCIWFDVAEPGARIALDVTDLRGNLVRTLIPAVDGQRDFQAGRYGQGMPGTASNCDNRFVWDGTGNDGRTVAPGVYLLRFQAGRQAPAFRRMLFLGR